MKGALRNNLPNFAMAVELFSGKYEIQGEIARGGMGVVYKAVHASLNRTVAIKVLHPQFAGDPDFLKRFQREARAMARLDHEHVIRVFDVGEEQGAPYIVMEYFEGKDLKRVMLDRGLFSPEEALAVTYQVADALAYAHARGIVHRDIKPGNIMLDARGKAKIADLGIAAAANEVSVTATGQIIGTPEYMSPEQARGGPLDGRSDLYSLGMVLYKMVTGKTLFDGISQMSIVGKLLHEGEEFVFSFPADVPDSLQRLVGSLLKRRSEDRVASAKALMGEIKGLGLDIERFLQFEEPDQADVQGGTVAIEPTLAPTVATPT
ncbi:MAG TPA: serine/threonine-protein kinase, partial [Nitrospiria bacterium]|nr:serine/threonine-protein kinase [Nitrospiria bacterium]